MKSERRHENETNWLASHLAVWIENSKPYMTTALVAVIAVIVVIIGYQYMSQQSEEQRAEAWNAYFTALPGQDEDQITTEVVQKYPGTDAAQRASLALADRQLNFGMRQLFFNRTSADKLLDEAGRTYRVLEESGNHEALRQRAAFSRARVLETQSKLEEAKKAYQDVTGIFAEEAKLRIELLDKQDSKDFYAWFATAESALPPMTGGPGTPGVGPGFSPDPLSGLEGGLMPGFGLPDDQPDSSEEGDAPADESDEGAAPSSDDESSSEGADAEASPAGDTSTEAADSADAGEADTDSSEPDSP